jgi:hypothetical protein
LFQDLLPSLENVTFLDDIEHVAEIALIEDALSLLVALKMAECG